MKNHPDRWIEAQNYEMHWWSNRKSEIQFSFYENYATDLRNYIGSYSKINSETTILEIGSGAGGILTYLKESKNRIAIDPLEKFYSSVEEFTRQRDVTVKYYNGIGEELPFNDSSFDLLIMDNVLDHCQNPHKVMNEAARVLRKEGHVFIKQNTYHSWGRMIRALMEIFKIDKGHPHTFSKKELKELIKKNSLSILKEKNNGYFNTWKKEFLSKNLKNILKAASFVTRDKVTYLLKK